MWSDILTCVCCAALVGWDVGVATLLKTWRDRRKAKVRPAHILCNSNLQQLHGGMMLQLISHESRALHYCGYSAGLLGSALCLPCVLPQFRVVAVLLQAGLTKQQPAKPDQPGAAGQKPSDAIPGQVSCTANTCTPRYNRSSSAMEAHAMNHTIRQAGT